MRRTHLLDKIVAKRRFRVNTPLLNGFVIWILVHLAKEGHRLRHQSSIVFLQAQCLLLWFLWTVNETYLDGCFRELTEQELKVLDNIANLEVKISDCNKMALICIGGYLMRKFSNDSYSYQFLLPRIPILMTLLNSTHNMETIWVICRAVVLKSLLMNYASGWCIVIPFLSRLTSRFPLAKFPTSSHYMTIKTIFGFHIVTSKHAKTLSNIFVNNLSKILTPRSIKEPKEKMLRLE